MHETDEKLCRWAAATLADKVVLITGASSGFGAAAARFFLQAECRLVVAARRIDRLQALRDERPGRVHAVEMDVRERTGVEAAIANLPEEYGNISVVLNNAGLSLGASPFAVTDAEDIDRMVDTNVTGMLNVARATLPGLIDRQSGHLINVGSIAGNYPSGSPVYGATKAFVSHFTTTLRRELLGKNVRVSSIEPGRANTEFRLVRTKGDEAALQREEHLPGLSAEDVARTVLCCAALPVDVNLSRIEMMHVGQANGGFAYAPAG